LFTAGDLLEGAVARSAPGFVADPAPPGGALAGPGTITAPFSLTFSKVGVLKQSLGPFTIHQEEAALDFIWASFGEGTNAPILFPSGLSISNLEYMILHPSIP
jgi:hypothetical protein